MVLVGAAVRTEDLVRPRVAAFGPIFDLDVLSYPRAEEVPRGDPHGQSGFDVAGGRPLRPKTCPYQITLPKN